MYVDESGLARLIENVKNLITVTVSTYIEEFATKDYVNELIAGSGGGGAFEDGDDRKY